MAPMAMFIANAAMGTFGFERNGILCTNNPPLQSSFSVSLISSKPFFGVALIVRKAQQEDFYSLRKPSCGKITALVKSESGKEAVGNAILEKEFEFRPSFDEYLRAMESVRTGQEKQQSTAQEKKQSFNAKTYKLKNGVRAKTKHNVMFGKVGERESTEKMHGIITRHELYQRSDGDAIRKGWARAGPKVVRKVTPQYKFVVKESAGNAQGLVQKKLVGKDMNVGMEVQSNFGAETMGRRRLKKMSDTGEPKSGFKLGAEDENFGKTMRLGGKFVHGRGNIQLLSVTGLQEARERQNVTIKKATNSEVGDDMDVERAAFKNFEEFSDVIDKRRPSRREMEERIQKLAKWLNGADINLPEWLFSKMIRSARIKFTDHSILRVIQLLGKLGNWRRVLQVIEWLQLRERFKSYKTRYIYATALNVLGKARRPVEALNVFYAMQQHMLSYPDIVAYRSIAVTLGQAGHMKELFDVIDCMRSHPKKKFKTGVLEKWDPRLEPDIIVYNAVLNACVKRKQLEGAFWVLQQLKQQGLQPSSSTYGLVMEVMYACGKDSLVHELFRKVQKTSIPNALTYKVLVNTLWREGKTSEAVLAVQEMERRGIVGSAALYYDLARCLCSAGRCEEALMQVEKISRVANKPLVVTYTGLIQACLASGNIRNGAYLFHQMQKFCYPNLVTCNIMMKAFLEHGMFDEAKELFQKMLEDGNNISSLSDYKISVLPDTYTFNTILDACSANRKWDDFEFVYERMLSHGYHFNAKRHLRMILDASRAGKEELLETTWRHLAQENRIIPSSLVKERFCVKLGKGDYTAAISCIADRSNGELQAFSKAAWLNLLKENEHRFPVEILGGFIDQLDLISFRNNPPNPVLQNVVSSCKEVYRTRTKLVNDNVTTPALQ